MPASAGEWSNFNTAKGLATAVPGSLFLMQESSGDLQDSIGSLVLAKGGAPSYQQAVAGWSRKGVTLADASADDFTMPAGTGPNPTTTSQVWLFITSLPSAPAGNRVLGGINGAAAGAAPCRVFVTSTGLMRLQVMSVNADSTTSHVGGVHIWIVRYDRANNAAVLYTDLEKIVGTYSALVQDGDKGVGRQTSGNYNGTTLYGALWKGADAEAFTDAHTKALLQALGKTITW